MTRGSRTQPTRTHPHVHNPYDTTRHDIVRYDTIRYDTRTWHDTCPTSMRGRGISMSRVVFLDIMLCTPEHVHLMPQHMSCHLISCHIMLSCTHACLCHGLQGSGPPSCSIMLSLCRSRLATRIPTITRHARTATHTRTFATAPIPPSTPDSSKIACA